MGSDSPNEVAILDAQTLQVCKTFRCGESSAETRRLPPALLLIFLCLGLLGWGLRFESCLRDCALRSVCACGAVAPVVRLLFSPLGTYLLIAVKFPSAEKTAQEVATSSAPTAAGEGAARENVFLIRRSDCQVVLKMVARSLGEASWPPLKFTGAESFLCKSVSLSLSRSLPPLLLFAWRTRTRVFPSPFTERRLVSAVCDSQAPSGLHAFDSATLAAASSERPVDLSAPSVRVNRPDGIMAFFPSPEGLPGCEEKHRRRPCVCLLTRGKKGAPSTAEVVSLLEPQTPVSRRSFYHCSEVACFWAADGSGVAVKTHTDSSDHTYYGAEALYFLSVRTRLLTAPHNAGLSLRASVHACTERTRSSAPSSEREAAGLSTGLH